MPSARIWLASSRVDHGCSTSTSFGLLGLVAYGDYQVSGGLKKGIYIRCFPRMESSQIRGLVLRASWDFPRFSSCCL